MIKNLIALTKPRIIFGNILTAIGGFTLASKGAVHYGLFLETLIGLSFIIASACICNNYIDRRIDEKMARTKNRPLVLGTISVQVALYFALLLLICGSFLLSACTNMLTLIIALSGFVIYVFPYSFLKHSSRQATVVGSIAGAIPPLMGYTAVTNRVDLAACILFAIVVLWQMPHFFAIALYRLDEYTNAAIPVLPAVKGVLATKKQMLMYTTAFLLVAPLLWVYGYTGYIYLTVSLLLSALWLRLCIQGFSCSNDTFWAKKMFLYSLVIITTLCIIIPIDVIHSPYPLSGTEEQINDFGKLKS